METTETITAFPQTFKSNNLCRICLIKGTPTIQLNKNLSRNSPISLLNALEHVMGVKLNVSSTAPQVLCRICARLLKIAYELKLQFDESEKKINLLINKPELTEKNVHNTNTILSLDLKEENALTNVFVKTSQPPLRALKKKLLYLEGYVNDLDQEMKIDKFFEAPDNINNDNSEQSIRIKIEIEECDLSHIKIENQDDNFNPTNKNQDNDVSLITNIKRSSTDDRATSDVEEFICATCNESYSSKRHLIKHIRCHRNICTYCSEVFLTKQLLSQHTQIHITDDKPYSCQYCDYKSNRRRNLKTHMLIHTRKKKYACNYCSFKATQSAKLKIHNMLIHSGEFCSFKGRQKTLEKTHLKRQTVLTDMLLNHKEKGYVCRYCPFKSVYNDKRHMLTHTGERPHACQLCPFKTTQKCHLKTHMLTHTGEKPHECQHCPYKSTKKHNLQVHMLGHSGEKPYACQYCNYRTKQASPLRKHLLTHSRRDNMRHACQNCDFRTTKAKYLERHMLKRHVEEKSEFAEG